MYEKLVTEVRGLDRDSSPRVLRQNGLIPGVIFGKGIESLPIKVASKTLHKFLQTGGRIFELEVKGGETHLVNLDNLQWDALGNRVMHASFHKLKKGQKTKVSLELAFVGEAKGQKEGGVIHTQLNEVDIEALPKDIPENIEVDISELNISDSLQLKDIKMPKGLELMADDLEVTIVSCQPPRAEKEEANTEDVSPEETPTVGEEAKAEEESKEEK